MSPPKTGYIRLQNMCFCAEGRCSKLDQVGMSELGVICILCFLICSLIYNLDQKFDIIITPNVSSVCCTSLPHLCVLDSRWCLMECRLYSALLQSWAEHSLLLPQGQSRGIFAGINCSRILVTEELFFRRLCSCVERFVELEGCVNVSTMMVCCCPMKLDKGKRSFRLNT